MTAPQFPAGWAPAPAQAPPAAPQQYAPPAAPAQQYAPPAAPQGYAPAPQQYAPPAPQYGYAPPAPQYAPPQPPPAPLAQASSLDDYLNQRASGVPYWKWSNLGDTQVGIVARELTKNDIVEATFKGQPQKRRDGSTQWNLVIPLLQPDGTEAQWEVSGKDRKVLEQAVIQSGGPANGMPQAGAALRVIFTHLQPNNMGQATKVKSIEYFAPTATTTVQAQVHQQQAPAAQPAPQQAPPSQPVPVQQPPAPAPQAYAQPAQQPQMQPAPQAPAAPVQPAPQAAAPPLDPQAQAQFAHLLGGAAPQ